jgi:hypothetical protein
MHVALTVLHLCSVTSSGAWLWLCLCARQVYLPVHALPLLLFRFKKVVADPLSFVGGTAQATLLSAAFLTMYGNAVKAAICGCRNLRG